VWQLPVERLLAGGLGTLPLAPISAVAEAELPGVIERMRQRLRGRSRAHASKLWTATYVLLGLRYDQLRVDELLQGVIAMEESVTYQAIIAKGRDQGRAEGLHQGELQQAQKTLLLLRQERFGAPDARVTAVVEAITDLRLLEQLSVRLLHAASWEELLELPRRRSRRPKQAP
jgi:predicted transposase YdaD